MLTGATSRVEPSSMPGCQSSIVGGGPTPGCAFDISCAASFSKSALFTSSFGGPKRDRFGFFLISSVMLPISGQFLFWKIGFSFIFS